MGSCQRIRTKEIPKKIAIMWRDEYNKESQRREMREEGKINCREEDRREGRLMSSSFIQSARMRNLRKNMKSINRFGLTRVVLYAPVGSIHTKNIRNKIH